MVLGCESAGARGSVEVLRRIGAASWGRSLSGQVGDQSFHEPARSQLVPRPARSTSCSYGLLLNLRRVIRGSIAAELSTLWEKAGATRIPRTLSAGTPLDSMFPM